MAAFTTANEAVLASCRVQTSDAMAFSWLEMIKLAVKSRKGLSLMSEGFSPAVESFSAPYWKPRGCSWAVFAGWCRFSTGSQAAEEAGRRIDRTIPITLLSACSRVAISALVRMVRGPSPIRGGDRGRGAASAMALKKTVAQEAITGGQNAHPQGFGTAALAACCEGKTSTCGEAPPPKADPPWITTPDDFPYFCALIRVEGAPPRSPRGNSSATEIVLCIGIATYGICLRPLQGFVLGRQEVGLAAASGLRRRGRWVGGQAPLAAASMGRFPGALAPYGEESFQGLSDSWSGLAAEGWLPGC